MAHAADGAAPKRCEPRVGAPRVGAHRARALSVVAGELWRRQLHRPARMIIQGTSDEEVDFEETIGCVRAIRDNGGREPEVRIFPGESHGLGAARQSARHVRRRDGILLEAYVNRLIAPGVPLECAYRARMFIPWMRGKDSVGNERADGQVRSHRTFRTVDYVPIVVSVSRPYPS